MGSPPTDLNALTGELTPPGIKAWAALKIAFDLLVFKAFVTGTYAKGLGIHSWPSWPKKVNFVSRFIVSSITVRTSCLVFSLRRSGLIYVVNPVMKWIWSDLPIVIL